MGFLKGTVTFSAFHVLGDVSANFDPLFMEQIRRNAFRDFTTQAQDKILGWTDVSDHLDTQFTEGKCVVGAYLLFALRMDRKAVPSALLRIRSLEAERAILKERNMKRANRALRDQVKEGVLNDLLKKAQPVPSFFEICWHPKEKRLYFTGLADKVIDEFNDLFKDTFNLTLQPLYPWDPEHMPAQDAAKLQSSEGLLWGREFLTWLWFKSEERNSMIALSGQEEVEVVLTRRIALTSGDGDYSEQVVCSGLHAGLQEGKEALRNGKKIKEARIRLGVDTEVFEFTFKADRFHFQTVKLPETLDEEEDDQDAEGRLLERLYLIEKPINTMERLFSLYCRLRLSPNWEAEEAPRMKKWLERV